MSCNAAESEDVGVRTTTAFNGTMEVAGWGMQVRWV
jgi:hypothetical protein